jgi:membrane-associated protease RseP (regulator of RpoE activity)
MSLWDVILDFIPWFSLSLLFWIFVLILIRLLKNKKEAYYLWFPLLVMFKTRKLNRFLTTVGKKAPKFWKYFWTVGIFVSFGFTIYAMYFFFINFINLLIRPSFEQSVYPLIPGLTIDLPTLFYLILPLLFVVTTHEFAHGISASAEDVDIKSTGVLGAGIFFLIGFGAFVEVDERELNSTKFHRNTRLRIAAAGTYVNGMTAGVAFILILCFPLIIAPFYTSVTQVNTVFSKAEGGFNEGNLATGDVILAIKKEGAPPEEYMYLDNYAGRSLDDILNNRTSLKLKIGDNLTFSIYTPSNDFYLEKNGTLGPRYYIGIRYRYTSDTELEITKIYSATEGGNNDDKNMTVGDKIIEINGVPINRISGDTLEKALTTFNLNTINLSTASETFILDVDLDPDSKVKIGIYRNTYFMHKNDFAKFFTNLWPEFWLRELVWLFIIAFSVTLFNMLPLPVFDGDRIVKELLNWGFGEDYKKTKKKVDKIKFKKDEKVLNLSEYRVDKINYVKILMGDEKTDLKRDEILLAEDKYNLIDKIGAGFKDSLSLDLPEQAEITEDSLIEVSYEHWYDEKRKIKSTILNTLRYFTLFIVIGNFILSFINFGGFLFWV